MSLLCSSVCLLVPAGGRAQALFVSVPRQLQAPRSALPGHCRPWAPSRLGRERGRAGPPTGRAAAAAEPGPLLAAPAQERAELLGTCPCAGEGRGARQGRSSGCGAGAPSQELRRSGEQLPRRVAAMGTAETVTLSATLRPSKCIRDKGLVPAGNCSSSLVFYGSGLYVVRENGSSV